MENIQRLTRDGIVGIVALTVLIPKATKPTEPPHKKEMK